MSDPSRVENLLSKAYPSAAPARVIRFRVPLIILCVAALIGTVVAIWYLAREESNQFFQGEIGGMIGWLFMLGILAEAVFALGLAAVLLIRRVHFYRWWAFAAAGAILLYLGSIPGTYDEIRIPPILPSPVLWYMLWAAVVALLTLTVVASMPPVSRKPILWLVLSIEAVLVVWSGMAVRTIQPLIENHRDVEARYSRIRLLTAQAGKENDATLCVQAGELSDTPAETRDDCYRVLIQQKDRTDLCGLVTTRYIADIVRRDGACPPAP
ncbi:MAG: hypothetical protein HY341_01780 [Candidatus Kerfeldbacteria bacterium]|nr:hypothetical protein [Candidatus Kerfeldbacteria bacterium]